jgi:hypothetical protein
MRAMPSLYHYQRQRKPIERVHDNHFAGVAVLIAFAAMLPIIAAAFGD